MAQNQLTARRNSLVGTRPSTDVLKGAALRIFTKKTIAKILALVTFISILPVEMVFANIQNPVTVQNIIGGGFGAGGAYNVNFTWQTPAPSTTSDTRPGIQHPDGGHQHHPLAYEIFMRNASVASSTFNHAPFPAGAVARVLGTEIPHGPLPAPVPSYSHTFALNTPPNAPGSIYSFQIIPYHTHLVFQQTPGAAPNVGVYVPIRAPQAVPMAQQQQLLFMTDIRVDVENVGGSMQVTWDNPTFDGSQIFSSFRIQWSQYSVGGSVSSVDVTPATWQVAPGNRLSYIISPANLVIGQRYDVEVIPLLPNGSPLPDGTSTVFIGGTSFPLTRRFGAVYNNTDFYLNPTLEIRPEGQNNLWLSWSLNPPTDVEQIRIYSATLIDHLEADPISPSAVLLQQFSGAAQMQTTLQAPRPLQRTYFIVVYTLTDGATMRTNIAIYDPVNAVFTPYSPTIRTGVFGPEGALPPNIQLDLTWRAFTRPPYTPEEVTQTVTLPETPPREVYIDRNIEYTIWISDQLASISGTNVTINPVEVVGALALGDPELLESNVDVNRFDFYYNRTFSQFVNSSGAMQAIQDNRIYYIRIQAQRTVGTELETSQPAFYAIFVPPMADISLVPPMVPVRIMQTDGVEEITDTSITINWNLTWFEAYGFDNNWYDVINVTNGNLVVGREAMLPNVHPPIFLWDTHFTDVAEPLARARILEALLQRGLNIDPNLIPIRLMDVRGVNYEVHTVAYSQMTQTAGTNELYISNNLLNVPAAWIGIGQGSAVPGTTNQRQHEITMAQNPAGAIQPNTSYVIFFRPTNVAGPAHYPTYTTGTTLVERPPLEVDPTTPILQVEGVGDTYIELSWNGTFEFEYQLFFSNLLSSFPEGEGRIAITNAQIVAEGEERNGRIYFTVHGLFPQTLYHFWIRAVVDDRNSAWSNPVSATTLPIQAPQAPTAISLASASSMQTYNVENGTTLSHGHPDHPDRLILEFMRIFADLNNPLPAETPQTGYTTVGGEATWLSSPNIISTYMVMFEELVANRRHYVRVRTVLTVTRGEGDTGIIRSYNYIMELSISDDFLDVIQITLPNPIAPAQVPGQVIIVQSPWSNTYSFFTGQTDGEFDGDVNPDLFPLPDQDFEYIYNMGVLTYRFRSNQIGADGNRDNQVDQRFISRLVQNRTFNFEVYVSTWGPFPVHTRVVEIPFGIIEAFDERQINLIIKADNLTVTIPYGSIVNDQVRNMPGLNRFTPAIITISELGTPTTGAAANLFSQPHSLEVVFREGINTVSVSEFLRPINLQMLMPLGHNVNTNSISGYISQSHTDGWQRVSSNFTPPMASPAVPTIGLPGANVSFSSWHTGFYTVISTSAPTVAAGATQTTLPALQRINTQLNITDLTNYNENSQIHANQFNQLLAAVATGETSVSINTPIDQGMFQSLGRSGMLVSGDTVSRESGIASLVRLFEVRTGHPVAFFPSVYQSSFSDIGTVSAQFQVPLLKAEALGFVIGPAINPNAPMTFGDTVLILDIILSN